MRPSNVHIQSVHLFAAADTWVKVYVYAVALVQRYYSTSSLLHVQLTGKIWVVSIQGDYLYITFFQLYFQSWTFWSSCSCRFSWGNLHTCLLFMALFLQNTYSFSVVQTISQVTQIEPIFYSKDSCWDDMYTETRVNVKPSVV